jgi:DNA-binding transcriptional LysR family regulator
MRRLPPLNALRVFDAAARHLNFSAAAEELCVTHSAVSHQIRQLEAWFGHTLFSRHAGGVSLSDIGRRLQQTVGPALASLEEGTAAILRTQARSEVTLGAPGSFLANWLIPRLERFEAAYPQILLRLQTSTETEDLLRGRIDALILSGAAPWPAGMATTPLLDEWIGPVCAPAYALNSHQAAELLRLPLLHTSSRQSAWQDWAKAHELGTGHWSKGRHFDHLPLMLEAVRAGLGIGIAPALLVERELAAGTLRAPFGFEPGPHAFTLCLESARTDNHSLDTLRAWLLEEAAANQIPAHS